MLIFAFSNEENLLSIFQKYCCETEHRVIVQNPIHVSFFFKILSEEIPTVVFIDSQRAQCIFDMPEWSLKQPFVKEHYIKFCGIGKFLPKDTTICSYFDKFFFEPLNLEAITRYLCSLNDIGIEKRVASERRKLQRREHKLVREKKLTIVDHEVSSDTVETPNNQLVLLKSCALGSLEIDYNTKTISARGVPIEISPKEFAFLAFLIQQPNCVVAAEEIIRHLWPGKRTVTKSDVHQYVYMLRNKLEIDPHKPRILVTVRGFGYKLCA